MMIVYLIWDVLAFLTKVRNIITSLMLFHSLNLKYIIPPVFCVSQKHCVVVDLPEVVIKGKHVSVISNVLLFNNLIWVGSFLFL